MTYKIINEEQLDFDDVMIKPIPSTVESRADAKIVKPFRFMWSGKTIEGNPAIASNMDCTGTFSMAQELEKHQMFCALSKHYSAEDIIRFLEENKRDFGTNDYVFVSTGLRQDDFEKLKKVMATKLCQNIRLDAPNGYIQGFVQHLNRLRTLYPAAIIMAGNVVTPEKTKELICSGADVAVVGIGGGSQCSTRVMTGVGRSQLSAVLDCVDVAKEMQGMVCSDGGVQKPADYVKAIAANADFVMMGGYFAGCSEAAGQFVRRVTETSEVATATDSKVRQIKEYKLFYGMSSEYAQNKHYNGMERYRASEGIVSLVPYTGPVAKKIQELEGGLRSAMTYTNSRTIDEFQKNAQFYKVRHQINRNAKAIERE